MIASNIQSRNWQPSLYVDGDVALGIDDIRQCIDIILRTRKGDDPLRPHFGCDLWEWIDRPINTAIPNMKKAILESLSEFEKRIRILNIKEKVEKSRVFFNIAFKVGEEETDAFIIEVDPNQTTIKVPLVLVADYSPSFRHILSFSLNGADVLPTPPSAGFETVAEMMDWIHNNWYMYGNWYWLFTQNKVIFYAKPSYSFGMLSVTPATNSLAATFPLLDEGDSFAVVFTDRERISPWDDESLLTKQQVLDYVSLHYASYGSWSVEGNSLVLNGTIDLVGYSLNINTTSTTSAFSTGFSFAFES